MPQFTVLPLYVSRGRLLWAILSVASVLAVGAGPGHTWAQHEVYFAPDDRPGDKLVALLAEAHRSLFIAMYGLTFPPAVQALSAARKRGVDVRVLTDRERLHDPKQVRAIQILRGVGIPVRINRHENLMHLKMVVIDARLNASGSMNFTTSGDRYNDERLDVFHDAASSERAAQHFLRLWNDPERTVDLREVGVSR